MTAIAQARATAHERRRRRLRASSPWRQPNLGAYLARTKNIDELIETGDLPDPFYGNYRVVAAEDVVVVAPDRDERFAIGAYSAQVIAQSGGVFQPTRIGSGSTFGDPESGRRFELVTADFDFDGRDEVLWATCAGGKVHLEVGRIVGGTVAPAGTCELLIAPAGELALVAGAFNIPTGAQTATLDVVLGWVDAGAQTHLELFEVTRNLQILQRDSTVDGTARASTSTIALAAGDLLGDGAQTLVAASPGPQELRVAVYSVDDVSTGLKLTERAAWEDEKTADAGRVAVACGDFDFDAADEIAVAWEAPGRRFTLRLIAAEDDYGLVPKGRYDDPANGLDEKGLLAVACGRLGVSAPVGAAGKDLPEPSQIAVGYQIAGHLLQLRVIESDSALELGKRAVKSSRVLGAKIRYQLLTEALRLQVATVGGGAVNSIVVGALGSTGNPFTVSAGLRTLTIGLAAVSADLTQIQPVEPTTCYVDANVRDRSGQFSFALATGDLRGASLQVGPPRKQQAPLVNQVLAVLNAPPTHVVKIDGLKQVNVNFDESTFLTFQNSRNKQTTVQFQTTKNWGYSEQARMELTSALLELDSSLTTRYGENFDRVSAAGTQYTFASNVPSLWQEDQAVLMTTDYTVWEYDVVDGGTGVRAPMAVIFPATTKPHLTIEGTKNMRAYYTPDHLVGNVLSYREFGQLPAECDPDAIIYSVTREIGVSATDDALTWQTTTDDTENRRREQSLSVAKSGRFSPQFRGITFGISLQTDGEYSETEFTSTQSQIQESTSIGVFFAAFANPSLQPWAYRVQPIWYWARWGYLALDYIVDAPEDKSFPTRWQRRYTGPDLAFALPYASLGKSYAFLTRDLTCTPTSTGDVKIEGVVRNFSLKDAANVKVNVYNGKPANGDLIGSTVVLLARARQASPFSLTWVGPTSGSHNVWAVIDPDKAIPDLYRANNRAWTRVSVP